MWKMIWGFIKKNWKLVVIVLLVAALCVSIKMGSNYRDKY